MKTAIVFDSNSWSKTGDIGDNSSFWKKAEVIRYRGDLVDVKFEDGKISNGHFKSGIKIIEP